MKTGMFPWEIEQYERHLSDLRLVRRKNAFLLNSIHSIACRVNESINPICGPVLATELFDVIDDCEKQIQ